MEKWLAVCDFDGTLVNDDMTDLILENFADNSWKNIENDWLNGKITAKQCMQQQIQLLSARISKNFLADFCKKIALQNGVLEFLQSRNKNNLPTIIVSDGIDFVIQTILEANQIDKKIPVFSNNLQILTNTQNTNFDLRFPYFEPNCLAQSGMCKCAVAKNFLQKHQINKFFLVGDGLSDVCLAKQADFIFCRKNYKLSEFCKEQKLKCFEFTDFTEISNYLQNTK